MQKYYICPECKGHLKVGEYIIFTVKNQKEESGFLLLHPRIGNYDSIKHPSFSFKKGEPHCFPLPTLLSFSAIEIRQEPGSCNHEGQG